MTKEFTVITPTGDRQRVFQLCQLFMDRQTVKPNQWIIIDDGVVPTIPPTFDFVKYIRRVVKSHEPKHTLSVQMLEALKYVANDIIFIMEDDDYYFSNYFEKMLTLFNTDPPLVELVGQGQAFYYNFYFQKYHTHNNIYHASWCQTGFRRTLIPTINVLCRKSTDSFIDMRVWKCPVKKFLLLNSLPLCIGMKGLPGRAGIGSGHTRVKSFLCDTDFQYIKKFIGNDINLYMELLNEC